jgi:hypothetical protein
LSVTNFLMRQFSFLNIAISTKLCISFRLAVLPDRSDKRLKIYDLFLKVCKKNYLGSQKYSENW